MLVCVEGSSWAWETDQLTDRVAPLADVTVPANAAMNLMLDDAAVRANRRIHVGDSPLRAAWILSRAVHDATAARTRVDGRGLVAGLGYGTFTAWLESADIPRREFVDRTDLYAGIPFHTSPILSSAGTCSTVNLGGVLQGTDKADHFLSTGWRYWTRATRGDLADAVAFGTRSERNLLGLKTSSAFSFADLHANWVGYQFYASLLDPDRGLFAWQDGALRRVRDFDWRTWVDWRWDELNDPSVYTPEVQAWLDESLPTRLEALCVGVQDWGPGVEQAVATATSEPMPWADPTAPPRVDSLGIPARCAQITAMSPTEAPAPTP